MINTEIPRSYKHRPKVPAELFSLLNEQYSLQPKGRAWDLGGSQNLNLKFFHDARAYVARTYRPWISEARISDIQLARAALEAGGVPMPKLLETKDGHRWTRADNQFVEVEEFVEYDAIMDSWLRIEKSLPWLGRIHTILKPVEANPEGLITAVSNNIDAEEALQMTLSAVEHVRNKRNVTEDELKIASNAVDLAQRITELEKDFTPQLAKQLVHGDSWDNNVFFKNGNVAAIVDLDFMGLRPRIDDLALTLFYTNSTYRKQSQMSDTRIRKLANLVRAYETGLNENLTDLERQALPLALARGVLAFIAMAPLIEDEGELRDHIVFRKPDIEWSLDIAKNPARWQKLLCE
jgi:Ser/Thr protein kinase RdoA (MazF antagonist)